MRTHRHGIVSTLLLAAVLAPSSLAQTAAPVDLKGHLRTIHGVEVLFLRGTDAERGFAEGYLKAEAIVELIRKFTLTDRVIPNPLVWNAMVLPKLRTSVELPDWVRERAEGIVEGIEARDADLLEIPELRREITANDIIAGSMLPDFMGLACSSFVAWGDRAETAGPIVGRNLDYFSTPTLLKHTMVVVHAPRGDRAGWVSVGWPGLIGCLTGVSDRGVSAAIHDVYAKAVKDEKITPRPIALQELIERLRPNVDPADEGAAILRESRFGMGGNFMVGWHAQGARGALTGGAVFEVFPDADKVAGVTVRRPAEGDDWVTCTNHHRARTAPSECWRFDKLSGGVRSGDDDALDYASGWDAIGFSEVKGTLYQVVTDLSTGELGVRARRQEREGVWDEAKKLVVRDLIDEAANGPADSGRR